jgi:hypothetical protein
MLALVACREAAIAGQRQVNILQAEENRATDRNLRGSGTAAEVELVACGQVAGARWLASEVLASEQAVSVVADDRCWPT